MTSKERLKDSIPLGDGSRYFSPDFLRNSKTCTCCKKRKLIDEFPEEANLCRYETSICKSCITMLEDKLHAKQPTEEEDDDDEKEKANDGTQLYSCVICGAMLTKENFSSFEVKRKYKSGEESVSLYRRKICRNCEKKKVNNLPANITEKQCTRCKRTLPIESFYKNTLTLSGYSGQCKDCKREWYIMDRQRKKERITKQSKN